MSIVKQNFSSQPQHTVRGEGEFYWKKAIQEEEATQAKANCKIKRRQRNRRRKQRNLELACAFMDSINENKSYNATSYWKEASSNVEQLAVVFPSIPSSRVTTILHESNGNLDIALEKLSLISSEDLTNYDIEFAKLVDIFPENDENQLLDVLRFYKGDLQQAINHILSGSDIPLPSPKVKSQESLDFWCAHRYKREFGERDVGNTTVRLKSISALTNVKEKQKVSKFNTGNSKRANNEDLFHRPFDVGEGCYSQQETIRNYQEEVETCEYKRNKAYVKAARTFQQGRSSGAGGSGRGGGFSQVASYYANEVTYLQLIATMY